MAKPPNREDQTPLRLLKTPPKPFTPKVKPKVNPAPPATKAEIAAKKRADKMVIKRMRKR